MTAQISTLPDATAVRARAAIKQAGLASSMVTVGGAGEPLHVVDVGTGPTLLFVHGAPMWSYTWRGVIERLRGRFRCVAPDLPGFGASPPSGPSTVRAASVTIEALVRTLDLRNIVLIANDTGGAAAFGAATRFPDRIAGLVALSTFAFELDAFARVRWMLRLASSAPFAWLNRKTALLPRLVTTLGTPGRRIPGAQRRAWLDAFAGAEQRDRSIGMLGSLVRDPDFLAEVERGLAALRQRPLLTIFGADDPVRKLGFPAAWAEFFAKVEHCVVPNAAHFAHEDDPEAVAHHLETWCAELEMDHAV